MRPPGLKEWGLPRGLLEARFPHQGLADFSRSQLFSRFWQNRASSHQTARFCGLLASYSNLLLTVRSSTTENIIYRNIVGSCNNIKQLRTNRRNTNDCSYKLSHFVFYYEASQMNRSLKTTTMWYIPKGGVGSLLRRLMMASPHVC